MLELDDGRQKNARVIAVMNNKGGCGKTTTAMALGMYLARTGNSVLFCDNDPQSNLTQRLGISDDEMMDRRLNYLFKNAERKEDLTIIAKYPYLQRLHGNDEKPGTIGILPGSHFAEIEANALAKNLVQGNPDLGHRDISRYYKDRIHFYKSYYDYIVIDTAPALEGNILNVLALKSSDHIIYPIDGLEAALGLRGIMNWMSYETRNMDKRPNGLFVMVKYQRDTVNLSPGGIPDAKMRNTVYRTMKNIFGDLVCDNGVRELRSLRYAIPGFGGKTEFTRMSEEISMKIRDDDLPNIFEYVLQNGLMMRYEGELSKIKSVVQRRSPNFRTPRYLSTPINFNDQIEDA